MTLISARVGGFFTRLFDTSDYPPRWQCGDWSAFEGWVHVIADSLIFLSYFTIPASLFVLIRRRTDTPFPFIAWLFVAFILSCGITHAVEAAIFWWPAYRLSGLMKVITASVSVATAVAVVRALPAALALPSIRRTNEELTAALVRERELAHRLSETHAQLETRTGQLTLRERRMRDAVGAAKACALAWDVDSGTFHWELGCAEAFRSAGLPVPTTLAAWADLIGPENAADLARAGADAARENRVLHRRYDLLGQGGVWDIRMTATPEPEVKGKPRVLTGVFGLVPSADSRGHL
ncbi:MAG: hypothetical protein R3B68_16175 [Phycisphaerales bacterium]